MKNFLSNLWSSVAGSQRNDVEFDRRLTVGSPSGFTINWTLKLVSVLVLVLTIGIGNAWGTDVTWTWTSSSNAEVSSGGAFYSQNGSPSLPQSSGTSTLGAVTWSYTSGNSTRGYQSTQNAVQIGANGAATAFTISTSGISGKIKSVTVNCASYQGKHKVAIKVGNTSYLSATATSSWTTLSDKTGSKTSENAVEGTIQISFTTTSGARALYIHSISVTYEAAAVCSAPTVGGSLTSVSATANSITATVPISATGGCDITANGLVYSTTAATPTVGGSGCSTQTVTACGSTAANKTVTISGLTCGTTYYVRGYATNSSNTSYTAVTTQATSACPKYRVTFKDDDTYVDQATVGASVTLPTRTGCTGYTFAGWTKSWTEEQDEWTTTAPTIIPAGSYTPSADENLYPVYTKTESGGGPSNDYELYSGSLTEGDYIMYYDGKAMNTTVSSDRLQYEEVTPDEDIITTTDESIIWHISASGDYWTIYNAAAEKYAASTGAKNKAQMLADGTDDKSLWTVSGTSTYEFVNKQNTTNSVNANLRNNGTYGFACYSTDTGGALSLYKNVSGGSTTYYISVPDCCNDPAVVSLVPDASTIYRDLDGNATTTIGFSQTGGGSGTWGDPTVSPSGPTVTKSSSDINFTATATGTYTVGIGYTETCEKTGSTDITVTEQGIISASGTATFSPSCGENSASNTFTVNSRYLEGSTITASITTTTGSGHFTISTDNSTFNTSNKSISGGTTTKVEDYIYVRYEPTADETGSIAGRLTLTQESTTTYVDLSGTVTCGCNIRFTSDPNLVQITAANGIWVQANTELALSGSFLKTNANNANVSIRAYTNNAHFQLKTSGTTGEGAAKTSSANALSLVTNEGSNTANGWTGSLGVVYKPAAHNTTETATLTVEVYRYNGEAVYASTTYTLYGRSLPENFVIAVNDGTKDDGHWYAIPADMIAPWGSNCTGLGTYKPYPITVNNNTNPTAVSGDAPARAIYTAAARTGNVNTNPQTMSYKSVALASSGNYYLYGSSSSETTIQNASNAESERQKWFLDVIDWANKKYNMRTDGNSNLLSYYISNVGVYSASGKKPDIYLLPVTTTCNNHLAPEGITCQGIDATNYTIRFTPDRTKNYEVSLNGSSWSDVTTSVVTRCNENDAYPKLVEAQIPLATYRGQTVYIRAKDGSGCPTSTTFAVPNPNVSVNSGTWMSMSGIAGSAFENTANSITISGLASCDDQDVDVTCSNPNISASVNQSTGVVTISMTAGNATAGEHTGTLTFTLTGGTTRTQNISIMLQTLAEQSFTPNASYFSDDILCDNTGDLSSNSVYPFKLTNQCYNSDGTVATVGQFNSSDTKVSDLTTGTDLTGSVTRAFNSTVYIHYALNNQYSQFIPGHRYRISWINTGSAMCNSSGIPYQDCHYDFVFSSNCTKPTATAACPIYTTSFVANWIDNTCSATNSTVTVYTKATSTLVDDYFTDSYTGTSTTTFNKKADGKYCTNDASNAFPNKTYGLGMSYSAYTPILGTWNASLTSTDEWTVTVKAYNGTSSSQTITVAAVASANVSTGTPTYKSVTINGASTTSITSSSIASNSYGSVTFTISGLATTDRLFIKQSGVSQNFQLNEVKIQSIAKSTVKTATPKCTDGHVTITGLNSNTQYYYTVTNSGNTSNEIAVKTRNGAPLIYFKDGGSTITSYTFDETAIGESSSKTISITASRATICDLNDLTTVLGGTDAGMFSVSADFSTWELYPDIGTYSGDITITYEPSSLGTHTATYTITDNGTSSTLTLNGTATGGQIEVVQWAPKGILVESYVLEGTPAVDSYTGVSQGNGTYQIADVGWDLASQANEMIDIEWGEETESIRVPIMVNSNTNSSALSSVTSESDIVVLAGKTLTINNAFTCHGIDIYPRAKVQFSGSGSLTADYIRLYNNGDTWENFALLDVSDANSISVENVYADFRIDESRFHFIALPFDVQTGDVTYAAPTANGANPPALRSSANNTAFYVRQYDGIARETNNKATEETYNTNMPHIGTAGGNYTMTAGRGYMIGIGDQASALGHAKRTLRFPIAMNSTKWTAEKGSSKVIGGSWVADGTDNSAARPVNKGWNLVGNPFMRELAVSSTSDKISTGHMVETDGNPRWTITEEDVRYITIYNAATDAFTYQSIASSFTLKPMAAFYIQMKNAKYINFQTAMAGQDAASPIRRTNEQDEEVNVILNLSVGNISDKAGVVLYDYYDAAYNETDNADYPKLMSNSQLALWSIAGTEPLASNGLPKNTAKDIPLGYQAPKEGQYIFTLDINESNMNWLKHVWLTDLAQNVTCDLMLDSYNFSLTNAEKRTDRFLLNVELLSMDEVTTDIDSNIKNTDSCHPIKFIHEDKLYILHDGLIYDMTGKRVNVINK